MRCVGYGAFESGREGSEEIVGGVGYDGYR